MSTQDYLNGLVSELRSLPEETGWVEFKENNSNPEEIGEYLSALSNTAALQGKANGYLVWGIQNKTHAVVGTTFKPTQTKKGNENLESWLLRLLNPRLHFRFYELTHEGKPVVLLEIPRALGRPVQFQGIEFIRVGSYRKKLKDHPQIERELWRIFDATPFEELTATQRVDADTVLSLLDYPSYFELLDQPLPSDRDKILARLKEDRMIAPDQAGGWDITNLGAILFAKSLNSFKGLNRKAVRVIVYEGKGRLITVREQVGRKGYASGFEGLIEFVNALLPRNEVIGQAIRKEVPMYPEPAIRELIPNALIHQDFSVTGSGPMIEIFSDRMEITNPGLPLVQTERFLDTPPRSRNEVLASFMRRVGICEERGSGIDKVVFQTEFYQLPAPIFETAEGSTRAVLFAHKALREMDRADRTRACYLHACLRYVERDPMTNSTLRERFGIAEKNSAMASRIIREAMEDNLVKPYDLDQGKKYAKYLPYWA
ncbi:MAG: putative DNA binding domain-containing protein [Planctomycetes bacterium]|nr:putative DNA binding domain-containing protein [Planctomycetota bacterium]MCG2683125.1 putative DNA binding domain-containing protein [Planctomycetales bacterium]